MSEYQVKYSCIIPCYNACKTIGRCIKSLCIQNNTNFEVIFVDDCSSDDTIGCIKKNQVMLPVSSTLLSIKQNGGPGIARNIGINNANGEYLVFMDSDDWYESDFFNIIDKELKDNDVDVLFFNFYHATVSGKKKKAGGCSSGMLESNEWYIANSPDSLCRCVFRRKLFVQISIPAIYNGEDLAVIPLLFSRADKIKYLNQYLYNYCYTPKSLSNSNGDKIVLSLIKANNIIEDTIGKQYMNECEFLGIKNVLYSAVFVSLRSNFSKKDIENIIAQFQNKFPLWYKNQYISILPFYKKFFLWCVKHNKLTVLNIYSVFHSFLLKINLA